MPKWAERLENVNVRAAMNGWIVNLDFVGPEKPGEPRRWDNQSHVFASEGEMNEFVKAAMKLQEEPDGK